MQLSKELKKAIDNNAFCAISTHLNDNEIQTHLMWVDYQDNCILINTEKDRKKTENIRNNSNISLVLASITRGCLLYTSPSPRDRG